MDYQTYPRFRYMTDGTSVLVNDRAEEDAIEGEHFDRPDGTNHPDDYDAEKAAEVTHKPVNHVHHEYPKMMSDQQTVVESEEEEAAWRALNDDPVIEAEEDPVKVPDAKKPAKAKKAEADDLI